AGRSRLPASRHLRSTAPARVRCQVCRIESGAVETGSEAIVVALVEQQDELSGLLAEMDGADWERPSRCEGWTIADVVLHLAQTNELAAASVEGRFPDAVVELTGGLGGAGSIDEGADLMVQRERRQP